jgi:FAD:protein FMN transferase
MTEPVRITRRDLVARAAAGVASLFARRALAQPSRRAPALARWDDRFELGINFEVNQAISRVHKPYVAVSIEDSRGDPVRTVSLWVDRNKGERWISELHRWVRNERERQRANGGDLIQTVSSATRVAGVYSVIWNGRDDRGQPVDQGEYYVCIECNRQNGTYQLLRAPFTFATTPFFATVKGNYEIIGVSMDYRERKR